MNFILIVGPQAVGKMTVGQRLAEKTNYKLFHNHVSIDFVSPYFDYGSPSGKRLVNLIRHEMFEEVAGSDMEGFIFTFVWAFDLQSDWDYVEQVSKQFESRGGTVYLVELEADVGERIKRNTSENRLIHKPTKRNVQKSQHDLVQSHETYRLNSLPGEISAKHYFRINNTNLNPDKAADMIIKHFGWQKSPPAYS
ncbi:shikimate kinase [Paenibacillus oryzae]|uniref:Shikimate kinase n=1 Tax=Paenibacillus oryzae TaxID=1844972 RepID=A0A1A5YKI5_9BACL|nr:AAA family ATPase [Paenibacillus oryzae]OBR65895.1 shikimate kinase [Paenibacillus oryzae]